MKTRMIWLLLTLAIICLAQIAMPARATIQPEMCIEPDIEYPVPCDDEN